MLLDKLRGLEIDFVVIEEVANMPEWSKAPYWEDSPSFTSDSSWLREKRADEASWLTVREHLLERMQGYPQEVRAAVMESLHEKRQKGTPPHTALLAVLSSLKHTTQPQPFTRKTSTYTKYPIEPLPEFFCLHFIGGPKSGTEEYWPYRRNISVITQGGVFIAAMPPSFQSPKPLSQTRRLLSAFFKDNP